MSWIDPQADRIGGLGHLQAKFVGQVGRGHREMGISLERGTLPPDLVTEDGGYGSGRVVENYVNQLSDVAEELGLARLDNCIFYPEDSYGRDVQEVPWYDPEPALATVRGLITLLGKEIPADWIKEVRDVQIRRLLRWGFEQHWVDQMGRCGDESSEGFVIDRDLSRFDGAFWDLLSFEVELMFAALAGDRFHLVISS